MSHHTFNASTLNRLHDLAKVDAQHLRRAAMREFGNDLFDDFWRGADLVYQRCLEASQRLAERSATRLQSRLNRRAQNRVTSTVIGA
jgi:hypothetical protein